jgi:hypothetical protein
MTFEAIIIALTNTAIEMGKYCGLIYFTLWSLNKFGLI